MKTFMQIVDATAKNITEIMPWDLEEKLESEAKPILIDIREPYEYDAMHIEDSLLVPRGILETACEFNFEETIPKLAEARDKEIIVLCRSGNRSVLAAAMMQELGYNNVASLKTGLRGWNDYELTLVDNNSNIVGIDVADDYFRAKLRPEQER